MAWAQVKVRDLDSNLRRLEATGKPVVTRAMRAARPVARKPACESTRVIEVMV
jgi:hypothetical protein